MELTNDFRVSIPPADAWKVLTDLERIAPMLPGAQLQEVEGDDYRGIVKVKVGPITAQYKGTATFQDQDEAAGRVVLKAAGRDTRGQGNASAVITATMTPDGDGTQVNVTTDLTVTGKVAQFGRGVLADVSAKLMGQFADTLEADLQRARGAAEEPDDDAVEVEPSGPAAESLGAGTTDGAAAATTAGSNGAGVSPAPAAAAGSSSSGPRWIDSPEPEPVDLVDVAGGSVARRLAPLLGGLGLVVLVVLLRRARRR